MKLSELNATLDPKKVQLADLVTFLVKMVVFEPDAVKVTSIEGVDNSIVEIHCDRGDYGILIGKDGAMIKSINKIVYQAFKEKFDYIKLQVVGAKEGRSG